MAKSALSTKGKLKANESKSNLMNSGVVEKK
jgi:hypothetical protein